MAWKTLTYGSGSGISDVLCAESCKASNHIAPQWEPALVEIAHPLFYF
jgi:hypothetical protein